MKLDFGHVLWVYKVAFEPKRYLTIPSGDFVETLLNRGRHCGKSASLLGRVSSFLTS